MFHERAAHRRWISVTAGVLLTFGSSAAHAAPERAKDHRACVAAHGNGTQQEKEGHLRAAEEAFFACATAVCGNKVFRECSKRYSELADSDIPTIVPQVTDERGVARTDVQVRMDGEVLTSKLDGQPLPVDPGVHEFSFSIEGGGSATEKVLIVQGQRNRALSVSVHGPEGEPAKPTPESPAPADVKAPESNSTPPEGQAPGAEGAGTAAPPEAPSPKASASPLAWVLALGGTAVAGGAAGGIIWSTRTNKDNLFLPSDIATGVALGAGVTALGAAIWLFATGGHHAEDAAPATARYRIDAQPTRSGAVAAVSGAF